MLRDAPLTARTVPETHEWMRSVNDTVTDIVTDLTTLEGTVSDLSDRVTDIEESLSGVLFTPEGGIARRYVNRTGGVSIKGYVVCASANYNNAVGLIAQNVPDPIGVIYEAGVADGSPMWVVTSGPAYVYYTGSTTRKNMARGFVTADTGFVAGQGYNEAVPSSPFATDKHFYEFGHVLESRTGAGLALTELHFN